MNATKDLSEFVIVHELVHVLAPNHGEVFKNFMDAFLPNWGIPEIHLRQFVDVASRRNLSE